MDPGFLLLRSCWECGEEVNIYVIFGKGGIHAIEHVFFQVSTSLLKICVTRKDFSAFLDMGGNKNWAYKISS